MKVTFTLKKETLDTAAAIRSMTKQANTSEDAVVESSFLVDAENQSEAFDQAAIKFAKEWLSVQYE